MFVNSLANEKVAFRLLRKQNEMNFEKTSQITSLEGALSRIISISLKSQNIYLCHRKPTNNDLFLLPITVTCVWLQMARMETDCNLKN